MKKILAIIFIATVMFSCGSKNTLIEDVVKHHNDGSKKVVYIYQIDNEGKQTWIRETWYYNEGMKHLDGPIVDGKRNGTFESYYKSGALMSKGDFVDGIREGKATTYHENGKVKYEGNYKAGKECGIWRFYDENGNLYNEENRD